MKTEHRPLILLTNDDGYDSPALLELAKQVSQIGDILISAPKEHHSGVARGVPFGEKARDTGAIEQHIFEFDDGTKQSVYAVDGTPALSVVHAILEIADRKPDLCISGINYGENVGRALNYSGTIGAAIEAAGFSIPSIAASQQLSMDDMFYMKSSENVFDVASQIVVRFAKKLLENPVEEGFYCLNLNIPIGGNLETPIEITSQAHINRWDWVKPKHKRDFSQHFKIEYEEATDVEWVPGTDAHALLVNKNISVTPISWSIDAKPGEYNYLDIEKLAN